MEKRLQIEVNTKTAHTHLMWHHQLLYVLYGNICACHTQQMRNSCLGHKKEYILS